MYYERIGELSRRIHEQTVSPVEVVDACLKRIETLNPTLNAFITVMADDAREQAKAAEVEIQAGKWRGPLHGLPVAVKDFFDTAGVRTTAGAAQFKDRVPDTDADVVKRLRHAGAIVIGKTNMDALGMATTGLTSYFGPVRNPWNGDYVTGGSSAGSAAAVAAGLCFATVDTDAVGSVRLPAACCGVVGFKGG
jgi:aspartyl-tRNA(Asn)/glutamyl-tRNA(Gln) amidotransferase subunit A